MYFQAIAHYEQSADYYKGEESNRQVLFFISVAGFSYVIKGTPSLSSKQVSLGQVSSALSLSYFQLCQQVSAEGGSLRCTAGAVPESHRDL
jgi:hypothetical protein